MRDSERITVEEWAGDNSLKVNDSQIEDLLDALGFCGEMYSHQFTNPPGAKTEVEMENDKLKQKIHMLELFISNKGHSIYLHNHKVTEYVQERVGNSHVSSRRVDHIY